MTELLPTFSFTGWRFAEPQWLMLLWTLPVLAVLMLAVYIRSRRSIRRLGDRDRIDALLGTPRSWNTVLRVVICMLALASIILASARPQSDPREIEVDSKGRDVVFLIDVSRSMLARDVAPNRLEKTKLWIKDLVDELGGDRVGLVAFAGSSRVISPLTNDRLFFKLALEELTPESVQVGGTNIGDAIRRTMELVFPELGEGENGAYRDIVLISDGEDQDSLPVEAARRAGAEGVRIIALGIGSDKGALIQSSDEQGQRSMVRSKLESTTLRQIAAASPGGVYLEVGTGTIDLAQVYQDLIASADQRTLETASTVKYTERFMVFLAAGIALIMLDLLAIPTRTRRAPA
ncbi:MAG: VWA domain-containing protein [Phycisphaerales bacterium JB047]